jgi:hypothetical protein
VTRRVETTVAIVNGLLVLLVPLALMLAGNSLGFDSNTAVTRAPMSMRLPYIMSAAGQTALVVVPFAAVAAWRSWVYARRWREQQDRGWRAIGEAGACALLVMLVPNVPRILTRPLEALPFVIVYGAGVLILGLVVGFVLRTTAIVVLKLCGSAC